MPKFNFSKGNKKETQEEERYDERDDLDDLDEVNLDEDDYHTGFDDEDGDFFDDSFGVVENPQDEDDLEAQAKEYALGQEEPTYKKAQPKWYEKGANIVITIVLVTVIVVTGLYVFREPIRGFIGSRSEDLQNLDLQGQVTDYQEGVRETLQSSNEVDEDGEVIEVNAVEVLPEGEYTVGVDIQAGTWVAEEVLVEVYTSQQDYEEQKNPGFTNVNRVAIRTYLNLSDGQFIVVLGGELVYNESREPVNFNIGDTGVLVEDEDYEVGKDLSEGFYTLYNTKILEEEKVSDARQATLNVLNASDEDPDTIGVERKTTVFLRKGLRVTPSDDLLVERVSSDGTYGDDQNILITTEEESEEDE